MLIVVRDGGAGGWCVVAQAVRCQPQAGASEGGVPCERNEQKHILSLINQYEVKDWPQM
jgi:hypothetical protein